MKVGISVWEGKVSPLLDTASHFLVCRVEKQREVGRFETYLEVQELSLRCSRIKGLGVDALICGAVSRPFLSMLTGLGVEVIPWIAGASEDVLGAYLVGDLFCARFRMPGCPKQGMYPEAVSKGERADPKRGFADKSLTD